MAFWQFIFLLAALPLIAHSRSFASQKRFLNLLEETLKQMEETESNQDEDKIYRKHAQERQINSCMSSANTLSCILDFESKPNKQYANVWFYNDQLEVVWKEAGLDLNDVRKVDLQHFKADSIYYIVGCKDSKQHPSTATFNTAFARPWCEAMKCSTSPVDPATTVEHVDFVWCEDITKENCLGRYTEGCDKSKALF